MSDAKRTQLRSCSSIVNYVFPYWYNSENYNNFLSNFTRLIMYVSLVFLSGLSHSLEGLLVMNIANSVAAVREMEREALRSPSAPKYFRRDQSYESIIETIIISFIVITLSCRISSWWPLFFPGIRALVAFFLVCFVCLSDLRLVSGVDRPPSASPNWWHSRLPRPYVAACCTCSWFRSQYSK